jgi:rhamnulokinase
VAPGEMPQKVAAYCREKKQPAPETPGALIRCVLESLALLYRRTFHELEALVGPIRQLHIVGGGSKNELLNRFTAYALGTKVLAGPAEATALGNVLIQAITAGDLRSLAAARNVVAESFAVTSYDPAPDQRPLWDEAYDRFTLLL